MTDAPKYTIPLRVPDADIDRQGHVNNVAFLRYIQDVAVSHWSAVAPDAVRAAFAWVVRRHELEYLRPALPGEELLLRTWVGAAVGATWERFTEVLRRRREVARDRADGVGAARRGERAPAPRRSRARRPLRRRRVNRLTPPRSVPPAGSSP